MNGLVIAKERANIKSSPDRLYVDSSTLLLKVFKNITGSLIIAEDGTFSSAGENSWSLTSSSSSSYNYDLIIKYPELSYAPQFEGFLDQVSMGKRMRLGNLIAGVGLEGDCGGFISGGTDRILLTASVLTDVTLKPRPGTYGYFVQIYYDRAERE